MPRVEHSSAQTAEVNCTPLSEVRVAGTPNLLTQLLKKAAAQLEVEVLTSGTASAHLVLLSTMVRRWVQPPGEAGRGPTMSMCTWENRLTGSCIGWTCVCTVEVTLPLAHLWQSLQKPAMSAAMPRHTKQAETIRLVALMPG